MQRSVYRSALWLSLLSLVTSVVLFASPALAVPAMKILTSSPSEFNRGKYGLTGAIEETNGFGGAQLARLGTIKLWSNVSENGALCSPISNMAVATFNNHIYSVGGSVQEPVSTTADIVSEVCHTEVTSREATIEPWGLLQPLPQGRSSAAAVAVPHPTNPDQGVLIVSGGFDPILQQSTQEVWSTIINSDGTLGEWRAEPALLDFLAAHSMETYTSPIDGTTYVYVFGGFDKTIETRLFKTVYRATVTADGHLSAWTSIGNMPVPNLGLDPTCDSRIGMHSMAVEYIDVAVTDATTSTSTIPAFVTMGGIAGIGTGQSQGACTAGVQATTAVRYATINPTTGDLTWSPVEYSLPQPLSQMGSVSIYGTLFTSGGAIGADQVQATNLVMSSYMQGNPPDFPSYAEGNFLQSTTALIQEWARTGHGMVYVVIDNRPIAFMFGGKDNEGDYRTDTLFGYIGLPEDYDDTNSVYPNVGSYESEIYELQAPSQITRISWTASVPSAADYSTDLIMQYRVGTSRTQILGLQWNTVDGDPNSGLHSINGQNAADIPIDPESIGQFVQYRALLSTTKPDEPDATPILRGPISINYDIDGFPNLLITAASIPTIEAGVDSEATVTIVNQKPVGSTENLLDANIEGQGTFFVYMYAFAPGEAVVMPTPAADGTYPLNIVAFAEVNRNNLPADGSFIVPDSAWKLYCATAPTCSGANWRLIFNQVGTWNVVLAVDGGNNVTEAEVPNTEWETDNTFQFQVVSNFTGGRTFFPILRDVLREPPRSR